LRTAPRDTNAKAPRHAGPPRDIKCERTPPCGALSVLIKRRRPTLPGPCGPSTIGAEGLNFSVRNGKRCFPLAIATERLRDLPPLRAFKTAQLSHTRAPRVRGSRAISRRSRQGANPRETGNWVKNNPSSPRAISTGRLSTLLCLHRRPINLVVFQGSYSLEGMGELISRWASRLDAFSGYPIRT
jgi:hypothetical protein